MLAQGLTPAVANIIARVLFIIELRSEQAVFQELTVLM